MSFFLNETFQSCTTPSVETNQHRGSYTGGRRYTPQNAMTTQSRARSHVQQRHEVNDYSAISVGLELLTYVGLSFKSIFGSFSGQELNLLYMLWQHITNVELQRYHTSHTNFLRSRMPVEDKKRIYAGTVPKHTISTKSQFYVYSSASPILTVTTHSLEIPLACRCFATLTLQIS